MKVSFSVQDISELLEELSQQIGTKTVPDKYENLLRFPSSIGDGWLKSYTLRPGLELTVQNVTMHKQLILDTEDDMGEMPFNLGFNVSGDVRGVLKGYKDELDIQQGQSTIGFGTHVKGVVQHCVEQPFIYVGIVMDPTVFNDLLDGQTGQIPTRFQRIIEGKDQSPYIQASRIMPDMKRVIQQILNCPYQGVTKRLYMESKALELIAYSLHQAAERQDRPLKLPALKPTEVEKIHWAKEILLNNMSDPPTLAALAKQVELNEYKLKIGFRQVLGTTAFGCLREHRMQHARQLLMSRPLSIVEVARIVGYASETSFSAAFKEKFGMAPSIYRGSTI